MFSEMTKPHIIHNLLLLAVAVVSALPAHAQKWDMEVAADSTLRMDSTFFADDASQLFRYYFIEAVAQQNRGNEEAAFLYLRRCLDINPDAAEAHFLIASHYTRQSNDSLARTSLERAAALQPKNNDYVEALGQFYIHQGEYPAATQAYESLYAANKSRADVVELLLRLYYVQDQPDKMLEMLDRLETINGSSEQISLSRMQIYAKLGKRGKQLDELKSLAAKHPNDLNYRIMMGNWLLQNDRPKEAFPIFRDALKEEPDNASAQMSMLDYYRHVGENSRADQLLDQLLLNPKTAQKTKLTLLQQAVYQNRQNQRDDSLRTLQMIDRVLSLKQEDASIAIFKAAYMNLHDMPVSEVNKVYEQALAIEPDNEAARIQLIMNIWKDEDWDRIIELSSTAQEYHPENMSFYYFEGMAEFQKGNEDAALSTLRKGVTQITSESNAALASDFYAIMGDILHNKGMDNEAFAAYDSCLVYKADNIGALNNYAYYLCLKDSALDRAEQMSHQAIIAEPDNSTYLDTYAWILFCQGRYADALTYIERAVAADSTLSSVVKEHTGDIYAMNGNIEKALEYWQKALSFDKDNAILQEKIRQQKYIKR